MVGIAWVGRVAGRGDDDRLAACPQNRQGLDDQSVVLVNPELVGKVEEGVGQTVPVGRLAGRGRIDGRPRHRETDHRGPAPGGRMKTFAVGAGVLAAQHDPTPGPDLGVKADGASQPGRRREQVRQTPMLEIGNPGDGGERQPPAIELGGLEYDVDLQAAEGGQAGEVQTERERVPQAPGPAGFVEGWVGRDLDARQRLKVLAYILDGLTAREDHGRDAPGGIGVDRPDEIEQIVVAARPAPPSDQGKTDPYHAPARIWRQAT